MEPPILFTLLGPDLPEQPNFPFASREFNLSAPHFIIGTANEIFISDSTQVIKFHLRTGKIEQIADYSVENLVLNDQDQPSYATISFDDTLYILEDGDLHDVTCKGINRKESSLSRPLGLASSKNALFLTDRHRIRMLKDNVLSTIAGEPRDGKSGYVDSVRSKARFAYPCCLMLDADGKNLLVCDSFNNCIRNVNLSDYSVSTIVNGLLLPSSIVGDYDGTCYITDHSCTLRKLSFSRTTSSQRSDSGKAMKLSTIPSNKLYHLQSIIQGTGLNPHHATETDGLSVPHGLFIHPDGFLFIADSIRDRIFVMKLDRCLDLNDYFPLERFGNTEASIRRIGASFLEMLQDSPFSHEGTS